MKKKWKKKVIPFVVIAMLLTACSEQKTEKTEKAQLAMGRYVEETITVNNKEMERGNFWENDQGEIEVICKEGEEDYVFYKQDQEGKWNEIQETFEESLNQADVDDVMLIQKDDTSKVTYLIGSKNKEEVPFVGMLSGDRVEPITMKWGEEKLLAKQVQVAGGRLYIETYTGESTIREYDLSTGKFVKNIGSDIGSFAVVGDEMYAVDEIVSGVINCYDLETGNLKKSIKDLGVDYESILYHSSDKAGVYLLGKSGIFYVAKGEEISQKLIDGDLCTLSAPNLKIQNVFIKDNIFYLNLLESGKSYVSRFTYHEEVPTVPQNTVTIFAMNYCDTLIYAVQAYRQLHPDVYVDMEIVNGEFSEGDEKTDQEAIEKINTRILAGEGPDLLVLDDLPVESYIKKGILEDVSDVLAKAEEKGDYSTPLMHFYERENKCYGLPLRFNTTVSVGEKEIIEDGFSLEALARYQEEHENELTLAYIRPEELIDITFPLWQERLISDNNKVNREEMMKFLKAIKVLSTSPKEATSYDEQYYSVACEFDQIMNKKTKAIIAKQKLAAWLHQMFHCKTYLEQGMVTTKIEGKERVVLMKQVVGINSQSTRKEAAKEILELALSKEVQEKAIFGFPVEQEVARKVVLGTKEIEIPNGKITKADMGFSFPHCTESGELKFERVSKLYVEEAKEYTEHFDEFTVMALVDKALLYIIIDGAKPYFEDEIELEKATDEIEGKIGLYLMENK